MSDIQKYTEALKIASNLLVKNGEVSKSDIETLPFWDSDLDASIVVNALNQMFDVEVINKRKPSSSFLNWESIIRLKHPNKRASYAR